MRAFMTLIFTTSLTGCMGAMDTKPVDPLVTVQIESYTDGNEQRGKVFYIHKSDDLKDDKITQMTANYLKDEGFLQTGSPIHADIFVMATAGDQQRRQEITTDQRPVFGQTGLGTAFTTGTVNNGNYTGSTTFTPTYGLTGFRTEVSTDTYYDNMLMVKAIYMDTVGDENPKTAWQTACTTSQRLDNQMGSLLLMLGQCSKYFGIETGGTKTSSKTVSELKTQAALRQSKRNSCNDFMKVYGAELNKVISANSDANSRQAQAKDLNLRYEQDLRRCGLNPDFL